jgi:hypothetical protein
MIDARLPESFRFMREQAGWSDPPGRLACALDLARAELRAQDLGFVAEWHEDEDWRTTATDEQIRRIDNGETVYMVCSLVDAAGGHLAACGGIELADMDDPYVRVMEAELASEALHERTFRCIVVAA